MQDIINGEINPAGLDKIVVTASTFGGLFSHEIADTARKIIISNLQRQASSSAGQIFAAGFGINLGINSYLKNPEKAFGPNEDRGAFDVALIPSDCSIDRTAVCFDYNGIFSTQVQPEGPGSTKIMAVIIDDGF